MIKNQGFYEIIISAFFFGLMPIIVKLSPVDSYSLTIGRIAFTALLLGLWIKTNKKKTLNIKNDLKLFLIFAILHVLIIIFSFTAIKLIGVSMSLLLMYLGSVYLVVFSKFILKEKIEINTIVSLFGAVLGLFFITTGDSFVNNSLGYIIGICSGIFFALLLLISKILAKKYDSLTMTFYQNLIALPFTIPLFFFANFDWSIMSVLTMLAIGGIIVPVGFLSLYSGVKKVKGQKLGILSILNLIFPMIISYLFLSEIPSFLSLLGVILILCSIILIGHKRK